MDGMENEQNQGLVPETAPAPEPVDMAQAFKMLNEIERKRAEEPVVPAEPAQQPEPEPELAGDAGLGQAPEAIDVGVQPAADTGSGGDNGGSSVGIDAIDFNARKQNLLRNIQQQSADLVRNEFKEKHIGYFELDELMIRDEGNGQVRFRNPDVRNDDTRNPDYYFKSRSDAMKFIESWNKGVDEQWRKAVNRKQMELLNQEAPKIRLLDFAPTYNSLDEDTRNVFETLIAPYEISDSKGNPIGYSVDLNAEVARARKIVAQFRKQQPQAAQPQQKQQQPKQSSGPAMDMKTGNGKSPDEGEPKTIGEALKMYDQRKKKEKR